MYVEHTNSNGNSEKYFLFRVPLKFEYLTFPIWMSWFHVCERTIPRDWNGVVVRLVQYNSVILMTLLNSTTGDRKRQQNRPYTAHILRVNFGKQRWMPANEFELTKIKTTLANCIHKTSNSIWVATLVLWFQLLRKIGKWRKQSKQQQQQHPPLPSVMVITQRAITCCFLPIRNLKTLGNYWSCSTSYHSAAFQYEYETFASQRESRKNLRILSYNNGNSVLRYDQFSDWFTQLLRFLWANTQNYQLE